MTKTDWFTEDGAKILAEKIRGYWAKRGLRVTTRIEVIDPPSEVRERRSLFCVRSDMVNGEPVKGLHTPFTREREKQLAIA